MNVNIKYNNSTVCTLTGVGTKTLNTKDLVCTDYIILETTDAGEDPSDATAVASDIVSGKTAYISNGKVTGTLVEYDGSLVPSTGLDYLSFTANTAGSTVLCPQAFEYSTDKENWSTASTSSAITLANIDDVIYVRNGTVGLTVLEAENGFGTFTLTGSIALGGNIMSLLDNTVQLISLASIPNWCFYKLFKDLTAITSAPKLPATTLKMGCYHHLFEGCSNLLYPPALLATTIPAYAYSCMFSDCTSLLKPTQLLATTVEQEAMYCMFINCENITELPKITATGEYLSYGLAYAFLCTSVKIYDTYDASHPYEWRVPMSGTVTEVDNATKNIIAYTSGDHSSTDVFSLNTTYYLEKEPI